ncbi:TRA-1 regulated domain-containing protein [Caenorhabditis elegans]|uniref:Secreted protein n=1 Tax=Caenorhabditis elegans TaxID=6239 RepID=Q9U5B2_CAEEL|nr:Secreted protein [Caenorhabditis elegans]CCD69624.3 Secreted protein [Caenorhabditis elegans]
MNIIALFSIVLSLMVITEGCMKTIPPDEVYISSTLPYEETDVPEEMMTTLAMETSTETEKVCEESMCPAWTPYIEDPMEIIEQDGCSVPSCPANKLPLGQALYAESEILAVDPSLEVFQLNPPTSLVQYDGASVMDHFGIICEDKTWKITKYPNGIMDFTTGATHGADGSFDGKKTKVGIMGCT